jgi:hypothetical protein
VPYTITLYVVAILTIVVLGAAALVILMRLVADRRRAGAERTREAMATTIAEYRVGECPLESVVDVLRDAPGTRARRARRCVEPTDARRDGDAAPALSSRSASSRRRIEALSDRHWPAAPRRGGPARLDRRPRGGARAGRDARRPAPRRAPGGGARARAIEAAEAVESILRSLALPGELPSRLAADALLEMGDPRSRRWSRSCGAAATTPTPRA